ncbi:murein biosynthesis integral membrane protein MurJ [Brevibacterium litoralis]|uniref:murein biosynthesis integral membrane protein MurJ n=1 Tax=Brevibacterium litoralis TaxID=3138935 RepID=UPI0032EB067D
MAPTLSSLARSSALMSAGTLVSRVLGFAKAMLLAIAIGVSVGGAANAFDIANKVPNNLYMLLAGGVLNAVLVPQIVRAMKHDDGGHRFVNRLLTLAMALIALFTVLATLLAPYIVRLYSSGSWSDEQVALAVAFAYICLPQIFFYGLYTLLGQVLNARRSFGPYMWAPVLNNVVAILGLLAFIWIFGPGDSGQHAVGTWDPTKIGILAGSATLGVVCQALVLLWPLRAGGFRYRPAFGFRGVGLGTAGKVASWTFAALLVGQAGFVVISRVAASVPAGTEVDPLPSNAAYTFAYLVFMLPHSIVAVSLVTALFTSLSQDAANGDLAAVRASTSLGLRTVGMCTVFATVTIMALDGPLAMVITTRHQNEAEVMSNVLTFMVLGLVPFSANYLLQRVFYAYEDARTPFWIQLPQVVLTTLGVLWAGTMPDRVVVAYIGLAMSAGYLLAMLLSCVFVLRRIGNFGLGQAVRAHVKYLVAGVLALLVGVVLRILVGPGAWDDKGSAFLMVAWIGPVMLAVYLGMCWLMRVREIRMIVDAVRTKVGR